MDGILYMLNLAGQALQRANTEIESLRQHIAQLEQEKKQPDAESS